MSEFNSFENLSNLHETDELKQEISQKVFNKILNDNKLGEQILSKVKWSITLQKNKNDNIPWSEDRVLANLSGNLKGIIAEQVSSELPPSELQTVFSSREINLDNIVAKLPQSFTRAKTNKKGDVLGSVLQESLKERPLKIFDIKEGRHDPRLKAQFDIELQLSGSPRLPNEEYNNKFEKFLTDLEFKINNEILKGYTWGSVKERNGSVTPAGEFYDQTVIPDAILIAKNGSLVGLREVKAILPDELAYMLSLSKGFPYYEGVASDFGKTYPGAEKEKFTIGVDIDKEVKFVDILRGIATGEPDKYEDNIFELVVTNEIPDNLLIQYGELLTSYGYKNVLIQKLPLSGEEIEVIAKKLLSTQMQKLNYQLLKNMNFSDRELSVLEKYSKS